MFTRTASRCVLKAYTVQKSNEHDGIVSFCIVVHIHREIYRIFIMVASVRSICWTPAFCRSSGSNSSCHSCYYCCGSCWCFPLVNTRMSAGVYSPYRCTRTEQLSYDFTKWSDDEETFSCGRERCACNCLLCFFPSLSCCWDVILSLLSDTLDFCR